MKIGGDIDLSDIEDEKTKLTTGTAAAAPDSPMLQGLDLSDIEDDEDTVVNQNVRQAIKQPGEQATKIRELSESTGLQPVVIERNFDTISKREQAKRTEALARDSKPLTKVLRDPKLAREVHDDAENFITLGKVIETETSWLGTVGKASENVPYLLAENVGGTIMYAGEQREIARSEIMRALAEVQYDLSPPEEKFQGKQVITGEWLLGKLIAKRGKIGAEGRLFEALMNNELSPEVAEMVKKKDYAQAYNALQNKTFDAPDNPVEKFLQKHGERIADYWAQKVEENQPVVDERSPKWYTSQAIQGMGSSVVPGLMTAIATRGRNIPQFVTSTVAMSSNIFGRSYYENRKEMDYADAAKTAVFQTVMESVSEGFPLGVLTKEGGKFIVRVVKGGAAEGTQEMINEAMNIAYEHGVLAKDTPPEQILQRLQDAGIIGTIGGTGMGVIAAPFYQEESPISKIVGPGSNFGKDAVKAQDAYDDADGMNKAVEAVQQVQSRARTPEAVKTFVDELVGADSEVIIPAEDADTFFQTHPDILDKLPEEVADNLQESINMKGDVVLSKSDYLTYLSDYHEELSESLRNDMDGMNLREANEWIEEGNDQMEAEANKILDEMSADQEFKDSATRVQKGIKDQLIGSGINPAVAEKSSKLHSLFAIAMAKREGKGRTPEQIYTEHLRLQVVGPEFAPAEAADTFPQKAPRLDTIGEPSVEATSTGEENLQVYLDEVNSDQMRERMGEETTVEREGNFEETAGEFGGGRILYRNDQGEIIGAVQFVEHPELGTVLSNIYTRPDVRRQGIATELVNQLTKKYPDTRVDTNMTAAGGAFFGYTPVTEGVTVDTATEEEYYAAISAQAAERDRRLRAEFGLLSNVAGARSAEGWAAATSVTGNDGTPGLVHRGTYTSLKPTSFEEERLGGNTQYPIAALGVWFSNQIGESAKYGPNIEQFYLDIRNPKIYTINNEPDPATPAEAIALRKQLQSEGYDGIVFDYRSIGGPVNYVAFEADKVIRPDKPQRETLYQMPLEPEKAEAYQASSLANIIKHAREGAFNKIRDLKLFIQGQSLPAIEEMDLDLTDGTNRSVDYLVALGVNDALRALKTNKNAIGWYDRTVTQALGTVAAIHPEVMEDPQHRFAFTYALAVTSNGMKVDKNFELAEQAYTEWKVTGKMPTNLQAGEAQAAINKSLKLYNTMVEDMGWEMVEFMMLNKFNFNVLSRIAKPYGLNISGENADTEVFGAAILGPKIGNGFFSNLYGNFDQLTMDRWLMRTWGRWTGTLIQPRPDMVNKKSEEMAKLIKRMSPKAKEEFAGLGIDLDKDPVVVAKQIQKSSVKKANRTVMNRTKAGESLRKSGNGLAKYVDGQKEAPENGTERNFIRRVFSGVLANLQQNGYNELTMSDLQALLWYAEKRLYDIAKSDEDAQEGYVDDEAPDYANAARKLAKSMGISDAEINESIAKTEAEDGLTARTRPAERILERGSAEGQRRIEKDVAKSHGKKRRRLLRQSIFRKHELDRKGSKKARGYRRTVSGIGRYGKPVKAAYNPAPAHKNVLLASEVDAPTMLELDDSPEAVQEFYDTLKKFKEWYPFGDSVDLYPLEEYANMRRFIAEDGESGFAIKPDGELVSVFSFNRGPSRGPAMVSLATDEGATWLAAFDTVLLDLYSLSGFEVTERYPWDENQKPPSWDKKLFADFNNGEPDFLIMRIPQELQMPAAPETFYQSEQTDTPEFKQWFGDSKVVDEDGKPVVAHHGGLGAAKIEEFNSMYGGQTTGNNEHGAFHFTENLEVAEDYGRQSFIRRYQDDPESLVTDGYVDQATVDQWIENSNVYEEVEILADQNIETQSVYLKIENPIEIDMKGERVDVQEIENITKFAMTGEDPTGELHEKYYEMFYGEYEESVIDDFRDEIEQRARDNYYLEEDEDIEDYQFREATNEVLSENGYEPEVKEIDGIIIHNMVDDIGYRSNQIAEQYIVFDPANIKSINNNGMFSSFDKNIYRQKAKGQITFDQGDALLQLLEGADLSTFLHESGHFFFESMKYMAAQSPEIAKDMQILLDYIGVDSLETWNNMSGEERRNGHEKVARAFEAYLFEGKAPSLEMESLFQTFRAWLIDVYKHITKLDVELTDEVRSVFDRMLATDEQIREKEVAMAYEPLFKDPADMTPEAWTKYQNQEKLRHDKAKAELDTRSLKDMKWLKNAKAKVIKSLQKDAREKRAAMKAEVANEVANEPVYIAMRFLLKGEAYTAEGELVTFDEHQIDRAEFQDAFPNIVLPRGMTKKDGLSMDVVAEMIPGFTSGQEMVTQILSAEKIKDRVERITDRRMLETYGDISSPEALERAADEAVHNDAHTKFLHTELTALSKMTGSVNVLARAAKAFAQRAIAKKKYRDIKPHQYTSAEARAAKAAMNAMRKGDRESAAEHKRAQVLNNHFNRAATKALDEMDKAIRYLKKFNSKGTRKNIDADYLEQIDAMLERFDLRSGVSLKEIERRKSLADWIAEQEELGLEPVIDERLQIETGKKHYKEMTLEEIQALRDAIKNIHHLGKMKKSLLTAKEMREFNMAADAASESIDENSMSKREMQLEQNTWAAQAKKGIREFFAIHRKFSSMLRTMDGHKDGGIMWELFLRTSNERGDWEAVERERATIDLHKIFEPLKKVKLTKPIWIEEIGASLSKEGILSIALNWGNLDNRQRVMDGDHWTERQVQAILDKLTKEEWDFVQSIWDRIDEYWPEIAAKEKRVTGVTPKKVEREPVMTKYGQYPGGYYPIKADPERSAKGQQREAREITEQMLRGAVSRATTRRGHTKARADAVVDVPVRKDFGVIFEHVDQVIHDLAWHEWLIDANRLVNDKRIDNAVRDNYGPEAIRIMKDAIETIATGDEPARTIFTKSVNWLRSGASIAGMGWNVWTSLLQPMGLSQSMVRIGPKWVGRGIAEFFKGTAHMENVAKRIHDKSPFMRLRAKTMMREINEIRNKVAKQGRLPAVQDTFFYLIVKAQQMADIPTWLGAYEKAVANGETEERSVALADQAVLDSQGGGHIKDMAQIQKGGPLMKLWTSFYSYFSTTFNLTAESMARTDFKKPGDLGRFAVDMMLLYTLPATMSALMREAVKGDCEGDEACIAENVARENLSYMSGIMVGVRELSSGIQGFHNYSGPAGTRFYSEMTKLMKQIEQGENDAALWKSLNNAAGVVFHYPAGQVQRTAQGFVAIQEGEVEGAEVVTAPIFGPPR